MPWTTPVDRASGYTVTNTDWNGNLGATGNTAFLYGDTAWTNVSTFTNSWVAGGTAPAYRKVGTIVMVRGIITGGTLTQPAFTLPTGYRPQVENRFATDANSAFGSVRVLSTGLVIPQIGSTTNVLINFMFDTL